jgi:hypothetical protein
MPGGKCHDSPRFSVPGVEGSVSFSLNGIDWHFPAILFGDDSLIVPISPLHQSDGEGETFIFCPSQEVFQILVRVTQIALEYYSQVRVIPELRRGPQPAKHFQGYVLV